MATAVYLEHCLDSTESLPRELQRNFQLTREPGQRTEDKEAEMDVLAAECLSTAKTLSSAQRVERPQKIQGAYSKYKKCSGDKVLLAMQIYEVVDKHIRRPDADLTCFEADLKDRRDGSDFESTGPRSLKKGWSQKEKGSSWAQGRRTSEEDTPKEKKHKSRSVFVSYLFTSLMCWTCLWVQMSLHTACATRRPMGGWLAVTFRIVPLSGFTLPSWISPQSPKESGFVHNVYRKRGRRSQEEAVVPD